ATAWTSTGTGRGRRRGGIMAVSADLGDQSEVRLPQGIIRYRERGQGSPIVFVHGLLTNRDLWRKVGPPPPPEPPRLPPAWPPGSHEIPLQPTADLSTPGLGALVASFITEVGLRDVTLVGNDTGGAVCQLVVTRHAERIARLVLTSCDAFETFPPSPF